MSVDPQRFLVSNKSQVIFRVDPKTKEEEELPGPKLDWLEAFKAIKYGVSSKELDKDVRLWVEKYKKIVLFRDNCLKTFSKIPSEDLPAVISEQMLVPKLKEIFSKSIPITYENISKAIYLRSEQKLLKLYRDVAKKLNIVEEAKISTPMRNIDFESQNPVRAFFKNYDLVEEALPINIFKNYCQKYRFENSSWHPNRKITDLMEELKKNGPLIIAGSFGEDFYSKPSHELKNKIGEEKQIVWGWDVEEKLFAPSLTNPKSLGEEPHRVVIIGAQTSKDSNGHVYFVDPSSEDQKIYVISLDGLRKRIRDIWTETFLVHSDASFILQMQQKFGLFCKNVVTPAQELKLFLPEFIASKSETTSDWQKEYEVLFKDQVMRGKHPLFDDPEGLVIIKNRFMKIFDMAPEEKKRQLAREPLFPASTEFNNENIALSRSSTRPVNYVIFCGDHKALKKLEPYLDKEDYLEKGPYESTFMHCLVSGYEKLAVEAGSGPLQCAKFLLEKAPELAHKKNNRNTAPLDYAEEVLRVLNFQAKQGTGPKDKLYLRGEKLECLNESYLRIGTLKDLVELLNWQEKYKALIKVQGESGVHPVFDFAKSIREIKDRFMRIFDMAPEEKKRKLVREPLFPPSKKFNDELSRNSAKPLNYIVYCGDSQALKKIQSYLDEHDYLEEAGLFGSTLMHSLISGFQKLATSCDSASGPLQCAQLLLEKAPKLAHKKNDFHTSPLFEAEELLKYMELKKLSTDNEYSPLIPNLKEIIKLLKNWKF